jgi:hypothetical protein
MNYIVDVCLLGFVAGRVVDSKSAALESCGADTTCVCQGLQHTTPPIYTFF